MNKINKIYKDNKINKDNAFTSIILKIKSIINIAKEEVNNRLLAYNVLAFAIGIGLGVLLQLPLWVAAVLAILGLIIILAKLKTKKYFYIIIISLALGIFWGQSANLKSDILPAKPNDWIEIEAMVVNPSRSAGDIYVATIRPADKDWPGDLILYSSDSQLKYGENLKVVGKLMANNRAQNENGFDYDNYLKNHGIVGRLSATSGGKVEVLAGKKGGNFFMNWAFSLRHKFEKALEDLPRNQKVYVSGIFLGDKHDLTEKEKRVLSHTGQMDAFAVSGTHVGFVVIFGTTLASLFNLKKWWRFLVAGGLTLLYAAIVGFGPSVTRATVMALVGLLAYAWGEDKDYYTALAVAGGVCLVWQPLYLFDAGFQMSFAAAFGLFYLYRFWQNILPDKPFLQKLFSIAFGAQLAIIPMVAYYFYVLTVSGILIAPIGALLSGLIAIIGMIAMILLPFSQFLGSLPVPVAGFVSGIYYDILKFVDGLPGSWLGVKIPSIITLVVFYGLFLFLPLIFKKLGRKGALFTIILMIALLVWPAPRDHNRLEVVFVDVGQGDAALVLTPQGQEILIDGGGDYRNLRGVGENVLLPYIRSRGIKDLEIVINSHPHEDHYGGLMAVMDDMPVKNLLVADAFSEVPEQQAIEQLAHKKKIPVSHGERGQWLKIEDNLYLQILSPAENAQYNKKDANQGSLVVKIIYGKNSFLFTGDLDEEALAEFVSQNEVDISADILKIPHHGSKTAYNTDFYQKVNPQTVVFCVGKNNTYGHPTDLVLDYWRDLPQVKIYRTDLHGAISFWADGEGNYQVKTAN